MIVLLLWCLYPSCLPQGLTVANIFCDTHMYLLCIASTALPFTVASSIVYIVENPLLAVPQCAVSAMSCQYNLPATGGTQEPNCSVCMTAFVPLQPLLLLVIHLWCLLPCRIRSPLSILSRHCRQCSNASPHKVKKYRPGGCMLSLSRWIPLSRNVQGRVEVAMETATALSEEF